MSPKPLKFYRRVGFGLRPDEESLSNPLKWAQNQMENTPDLIWPGRIYSEAEMLDIRRDFTISEAEIDVTIKDPEESRRLRKKLYNRSGRKFFESYELAIRHYQAIYSDQPVFERFWHFWGNHFAIVDKLKLPIFNTGAMQREQIRPLMTGRFADMVYDITLSWPMIRSLDNFLSRGPKSDFNVRRKKKNKPVKALNENHARELLELHTVSPACGYTQDDVINAAYIMTGWGYTNGEKEWEGKKIGFEGSLHEPGTHKVLTQKYKASGWDKKTKGRKQLRALVEDLCNHESCRKFIAWKLCRHFICDDPTSEMVSLVTDAWEKSGGMLPEIHKAVLEASWRFGDNERKFLSPETWLLQVARMTGANWPGDPSEFEYDFNSKPTYKQRKPVTVLAELGHLPFRAKQPNGFPDTEAEWLSQEYLVRRISLINNPSQIGLPKDKSLGLEIAKAVIEKNIDDPEDNLAILNALGKEGSYTTRSYPLIAALCSERILKI